VADVPTPTTGYADHARTYLDWTYALTETYVPPDLVSALNGGPAPALRRVETVGAAEILARRGDPAYSNLLADAPNAAVRSAAYPDLAALRAAARDAGHPLVILSAYRSYGLQRQTFDYWVGVGGYEQALRTSARAGHSEHQLGTTVDFGDGAAAPWEYADWATTPAGAWLAANATAYGFVLSYPKGRTSVTCYDYEPWHYRWVGRALAAQIVASRLTLREYQGMIQR
jgi:D-alanyl-D-alanine carboxypeptidase